MLRHFLIWACLPFAFGAQPATAQDHLPAFRTEAELVRFLLPPPRAPRRSPILVPSPDSDGAFVFDHRVDVEEVIVTGSRVVDPGVTNVQEAGVDEGGIVKLSGDALVVLRRGRLFTISLANGGLRPLDSVPAFAPGVDADMDWYDEMLLVGDTVAVIGYSYRRGGTEINRFHLSPEGRLTRRDSHHLRSTDYYSSDNYASRMIGTTLYVYAPIPAGWRADPADSLPAQRRWTGDAQAPFHRIAPASALYRLPSIEPGLGDYTIHTITRCDLLSADMGCSATGVIGGQGRSFYLSARAAFVWVEDDWRSDSGSLVRIPLDGAPPQALRVAGAPINQFSFREDTGADHLDVLLSSRGQGDAMWSSRLAGGDLRLLHVPVARFGYGDRSPEDFDYRPLPPVPTDAWNIKNRFIGGDLLYSAASGGASLIGLHRIATGRSQVFVIPGRVQRLEALGRDALIVANDDSTLSLSPLSLHGDQSLLLEGVKLPLARQSESRSHGFFYRPDAEGTIDAGLMALPIVQGRPDDADGDVEAASIAFFRREPDSIISLGGLQDRANVEADDGCVASCLDWYGDARPLFIGDRMFALLGYTLIEGRVTADGVQELRRTDIRPASEVPDVP